jgi:uncharacterized protein (TIGR03790 family)
MIAVRRIVASATLLLGVMASSAAAQSPANVAVVINELSEESKQIGAHYARVRGLPDSNVLRIQTSTAEAIARNEYVQTIEEPLGIAIMRGNLQDRLLYLVLTKGIPLRINGSAGLRGAASSVDSELTLLYRRLTGISVTLDGPVDNPYYLGSRELKEALPFSHREHDIYLVTRLDGFTVADAIALVDRAQSAQPDGKIVLDQRAATSTIGTGDRWLERAAERLSAQGHKDRLVLETTPNTAAPVAGVFGLFTWGATDPAYRHRRSGMTFVPGAIAGNLASYDARTFREPPADWQPTASPEPAAWFEGSADALIGDLIRDGVTGVAGQVGEAFTRGALRPDILFPAYVAGFNLAESFYLSIPTLSWQAVVIGDPLTAPVAGRRLTTEELDERIDEGTGLPTHFSKRRIAAVAASNRDVPEASIVPMVRALGLLQGGDKAAAAPALAEAVRLSSRAPNWLTTLGVLQESAEDYEGAIATYRTAVEARPDNLVALNNLAYALAVHVGKPAEAKPIAERAVALSPRSATIIDTLAWVEHLLGDNARAAQLLDESIRFEPRNATIRLHAAIVFAELSQWKRVDAELTEALNLDPSLATSDEVQRLRQRMPPE